MTVQHSSIATCVLCEAACGIVVERSESPDGEAIRVRGDDADPMSKGFVCPKVIGMKELHQDPDRLRKPLLKDKGGVFREASFADAERHAAEGIRRVRDTYGKDALAIYQGNPTAHNLGLLLIGQVVLRTFGTKNVYSASSADQVPQMLAAELVFGNPLLIPVADLDRTDHFLILGANPVVSNGSLMTAPDMRRRIQDIQARGGRVTVVDPRRTETAEIADEHLFIRPGTDPFFLLGLLHVILIEHPSSRPLAPWLAGVEELREVARMVPPERAERETGVSAVALRRLAASFAGSPRGAAYGRIGICHQRHGTLAAWLVFALNAVTGNLDRPGGVMFTTPAVDVPLLAKVLGFVGHGRWKSRVRGLAEVAGELPIATLADEIETPGPGQVRALLTSAGNPVLSAPNGQRLERALPRLSFMVSVDGYLNETTRFADVILPPASQLERSHYDVALNAFAVRNVAKYVPAPIPAGARQDWELLLSLGIKARLAGGAVRDAAADALLRIGGAVGPEGLLDLLIRSGPHGVRGRGLTLAKLKAHPHGLDLGALEPRLPRALETKDKRVQLAPPTLVTSLLRMLREEVSARPGLLLVGRRHLRSNNSWMHNTRVLVKGKDRCTLLVHPLDAERLAVTDGQRVVVRSRVGSVQVTAEVSDEVMPGVVSLPHGFGHGREGTRLQVAKDYAGVSANDLTDDRLLDELTGNAAFSGVEVEISPTVERVADSAVTEMFQ